MNWYKKLDPNFIEDVYSFCRDTDGFYVYILWKTYKNTPEPFYVGKGHKFRLIKHGMPSENKNIYKSRVIEKHSREGLKVGYSIIGKNLTEKDALDLEIKTIKDIGRHDLKKGPLTNKTDGGDGSLGHLAKVKGESASARPVVANGVPFESLIEAAEAEGMHSAVLIHRIKTGWPGYYYMDEGQRKPKKNLLGRYRKITVAEGYEYASLSEASRVTGLDFRMISQRIENGWKGYYYVDEGQKERKTIWGDREDKVPVEIKGVFYDTIADASRKLKIGYATVLSRCESSNFKDYRRLDGKEIQVSRESYKTLEVEIEGIVYLSMNQAAKILGVSQGTITNRCDHAQWPRWKYLDSKREAQEKINPLFSSNPREVIICGVSYASQSEAARAHDIDISTLKRRCRSPAFPRYMANHIDKKLPKDNRPGLLSIVIDGKEYRSISQASKELGIRRDKIRKRIDCELYPNYFLLNNT